MQVSGEIQECKSDRLACFIKFVYALPRAHRAVEGRGHATFVDRRRQNAVLLNIESTFYWYKHVTVDARPGPLCGHLLPSGWLASRLHRSSLMTT